MLRRPSYLYNGNHTPGYQAWGRMWSGVDSDDFFGIWWYFISNLSIFSRRFPAYAGAPSQYPMLCPCVCWKHQRRSLQTVCNHLMLYNHSTSTRLNLPLNRRYKLIFIKFEGNMIRLFGCFDASELVWMKWLLRVSCDLMSINFRCVTFI